MKGKRIISVVAVLVFLVGCLVVPAGAADGKFTITPASTSIKAGNDAKFNVVAEGTFGYVEMKISYDSTRFSYVADSFSSDIEGLYIDEAAEGSFAIKYKEFVNVKDATIASFTLKACDASALGAEAKADTVVKGEYLEATTGTGQEKLIYNKDGDPLDFDIVAANVSIVKAHETPVVSVAIEGEAVIGKTLKANASAVDNWGLTPTWAYKWMADGEAIADATKAEYTVTAADFGKKITVEATATVEADENTTASKVSDATTAVIADAAAKASVANVKLDSDVVAVGAPVMVKYDFTASINGGEDKSEIAWTAEDGSELKGTVSEDGKTFTAAIEDLGKKVKVTVTPKGDRDTAKGDAVSFTSEAIVAGNPTATNVKASVSSIRVNKAFTVEYTYSDPKNGGEEAAGIYAEDKEKTVVAYSLYKDAGLTEAVDKADYAKYITVEDGKYTASADAKNLYIVFEVTPVNKAGIAGETAKSEAYKITKKSSSGGDGPTSIIGGKPTTSPKPTISPDPTKDPNAVTGGKDEIVLVINNKNASVWGEAKTNDVAPIIRKDRTMLPARFVAEALGAEVSWDEAARKVTIVSADKATTIVITIDSDKAMVNDKEVKLDSAAFIENDRTYTPIRFISESLGAKVAWDEAAQKVTITK